MHALYGELKIHTHIIRISYYNERGGNNVQGINGKDGGTAAEFEEQRLSVVGCLERPKQRA